MSDERETKTMSLDEASRERAKIFEGATFVWQVDTSRAIRTGGS